jgi:hypothetical protein
MQYIHFFLKTKLTRQKNTTRALLNQRQVEERGVDTFYLPRSVQSNDVVKIFKVKDEEDLKKQLGMK